MVSFTTPTNLPPLRLRTSNHHLEQVGLVIENEPSSDEEYEEYEEYEDNNQDYQDEPMET